MPPDTPQPETDVSVYDEPLHRVEYEHLGRHLRNGGGCKLVFFRVKSVGRRADPAITRGINHTRYWN